jgi:NCAIR mutase (PurE)-related protein
LSGGLKGAKIDHHELDLKKQQLLEQIAIQMEQGNKIAIRREKIMPSQKPLVGIVMGSDSDLEIMQEVASVLKKFEVPYEMTVASAHRSP